MSTPTPEMPPGPPIPPYKPSEFWTAARIFLALFFIIPGLCFSLTFFEGSWQNAAPALIIIQIALAVSWLALLVGGAVMVVVALFRKLTEGPKRPTEH